MARGFDHALFSVSMARYVYIVRALSRSDGWARLNYASVRETWCWEFVTWFWDMMVEAGEYITVDVKRTIQF